MASGVSSFKLLILSTGLLSMVIALKVSLPIVADFIAYDAPKLWSYLVSCFRPPYLYLLINSIILSIVASSKLQNSSNESDSPSPVLFLSPPIVTIRASEQDFPDFEFKFPVTEASMDDEVVAEDEFVISKSSWMPPLKDSKFPDKPPASARFSSRRSPKPSPEGPKRLGVSKPNRTETLENTWRTITDGRAMPLTRHLRKSDTFNNANQTELSSPPSKLMLKSNTFGREEKNSSSVDFGSTGKMRREASLSHDELNRRVEAFINKFNEEMRLQRQESLNHYKRMVRS
ncbi:unnamed protein product [Rhodiola kirilowii]